MQYFPDKKKNNMQYFLNIENTTFAGQNLVESDHVDIILVYLNNPIIQYKHAVLYCCLM